MRMPPMVGYDPNYEQPESELLAKIIRPGTTAIDIGAHTGHYTLLAGRYVSSTGKVLAVEPDPTNLVTLCQNVGANGFRHVQVLSAAVSEKSQVLPLYLDGGCGGDNRLKQYPGESRSSLLVQCVRLDDLVEIAGPRVEFVKIDVQGNEVEVLRGGGQFLRKQSDLMMLVEYSPYDLRMAGSSGDELLKSLFELGFLLVVLDPGTGRWSKIQLGQQLLDRSEEEKMVLNLLCLRGRYASV